MRLNEPPATLVALDKIIAVRGLYEELGIIQEKLSDLGEMNAWREDYRGWKYDVECPCVRCSGMGEGIYELLREKKECYTYCE